MVIMFVTGHQFDGARIRRKLGLFADLNCIVLVDFIPGVVIASFIEGCFPETGFRFYIDQEIRCGFNTGLGGNAAVVRNHYGCINIRKVGCKALALAGTERYALFFHGGSSGVFAVSSHGDLLAVDRRSLTSIDLCAEACIGRHRIVLAGHRAALQAAADLTIRRTFIVCLQSNHSGRCQSGTVSDSYLNRLRFLTVRRKWFALKTVSDKSSHAALGSVLQACTASGVGACCRSRVGITGQFRVCAVSSQCYFRIVANGCFIPVTDERLRINTAAVDQ